MSTKKSNAKPGRAPQSQSRKYVNVASSVAAVLRSEVLDAEKGLKQIVLAERCGLEPQVISELLKGRALTEAIAVKLDQGTHISAPTWMGLAAADRLAAELRKQKEQGIKLTSISSELAAIYEAAIDGEFDDDDLGDDWTED